MASKLQTEVRVSTKRYLDEEGLKDLWKQIVKYVEENTLKPEDIDLSNYVTTDIFVRDLAGKVDVQTGYSLVADSEIARLAKVNENAEVNYVKSVEETEFEVSEDGKLSIKAVDQDKVFGLAEAFAGKVDAVDGYSLVDNAEIQKLLTVEEGAEKNYISAVSGEFGVAEDGTLSVNSIAQSKVADLTETLAGKVDVVEGKGLSTNDFTDEYKAALDGLITDVGNLENVYATKQELNNAVDTINTNLTNNYVNNTTLSATVGDMSKLLSDDKTETNLVDEILALAEKLVWQELAE